MKSTAFLVVVLILSIIIFPSKLSAAIAWSTPGSSIWSDGPVGIGTSSVGSGVTLDIGSNTYSGNAAVRLNNASGYDPKISFSIAGTEKWRLYRPNASTDLRFWDGSIDSVSLGDNAAGAKLWIKNNSNNTTFIGMNNTIDGSIYRMHAAADGTKLSFAVTDGTTSATNYDVLSLSRNGDISMGKNGSQVNLYVNGIITTKQLKVTTSGWADYVFENNYNLMPLSAIESYIKVNKHLPDVPSAYEIEKDGVSVGDMQKLQMQKIEELTLHLIEKDKEINDLNARVDKLEKLLLTK